jgi:hypothetical protein
MEIVLANSDHLEAVARLFDQYRVFYQQASNLTQLDHFSKLAFTIKILISLSRLRMIARLDLLSSILVFLLSQCGEFGF